MIHIFAIVSALGFQHLKNSIYLFTLLCHTAWLAGSSSPFRGLNLGPSTVKGQSPNHWTAKEFLDF